MCQVSRFYHKVHDFSVICWTISQQSRKSIRHVLWCPAMAMTSQKFKLIQEHRVILYQIQLSGQPVVNPSPHVLLSYGDSPPIKPVGETELFCMHGNRSVALKFQIIPDTVMSSKPALLFGCDNERLDLLRVSSNVHSIGLNENDHGHAKIPDPAPLPLINASFIGT